MILKLQEELDKPTLLPEEQPYRNLLSAVVLQAVDDANRPYDPTDHASTDSTTAFNFLFVTGGLDLYCAWLGYSAQAVRQSLLNSPKFRNIQARYKQWHARLQDLAVSVDRDLQSSLFHMRRNVRLRTNSRKKGSKR